MVLENKDKEDTNVNNSIIMLGLNKPSSGEQKRKFMLFYPNDTWKVIGWDLLIAMILLLTCITTPFDLAFAEELDAM